MAWKIFVELFYYSKHCVVSPFVMMKVIFSLMVSLITNTSSYKLNGGKTKNWWSHKPLYYRLGFTIALLPYSILRGFTFGLVQLYRDLTHYYYNFYKKGKSIKCLYPSYKDVSLSKAINIIVSSRIVSRITPFKVLKTFVKFFIKWLLPLIISCCTLVLLFALRDIPVNKFLFTIVSLGFFTYLLISGFVFFLKKYKYGKYTTAMHRYWRRTFSIFWLLEGYLFLVFLYLGISIY